MSSPHSACLNLDGLTGWGLTKLNEDDVSRAEGAPRAHILRRPGVDNGRRIKVSCSIDRALVRVCEYCTKLRMVRSLLSVQSLCQGCQPLRNKQKWS